MSDNSIEIKALVRKARRAAAQASNAVRRPGGRAVEEAPEYDGDSDNRITNPFTGRDEIPWNRGKETAEEAIARFMQNQGLGNRRIYPTVGDWGRSAPAPKPSPRRASGRTPGMSEKEWLLRANDPAKSTVNWPTNAEKDKFVPIEELSEQELSRIHISLDMSLRATERPTKWEDQNGRAQRKKTHNGLQTLRRQLLRESSRRLEAQRQLRAEDEGRRVTGQTTPTTETKPSQSAPNKTPNRLDTPPEPLGVLAGEEPSKRTDSPKEVYSGSARGERVDAEATPGFFVWPKESTGTMKPLAELTDEEVDQAADFWSRMPAASDAVKKLVADVAAEKTQRDAARRTEAQRVAKEMAAREREMRNHLWANGKNWSPSQRWSYPNESYYVDGARSHGRISSPGIARLEIVERNALLPGDKGFDVIGQIRDESDEYPGLDFDTTVLDDPPRTIEDAMKFAEDLIERMEEDSAYDGNEPSTWPDANQISEETSLPTTKPWSLPNPDNVPARGKNGKLGSSARMHNWVPRDLDQARSLFSQKWSDRRNNASVFENIDFAIDRLAELDMLSKRMSDRYEQEFPGFNEAWTMSTLDFAQWAVRNGIFDTFNDAREYHSELMDAWDQLGADQEEISKMMSEIDNELRNQVRRAVAKADAGAPGFTDDTISYFTDEVSLEKLLTRYRSI